MKEQILEWLSLNNDYNEFQIQKMIGKHKSKRCEYPSGKYKVQKRYRSVDNDNLMIIEEEKFVSKDDMVEGYNQRQIMPFEVCYDIDCRSKEHAYNVASEVQVKLIGLGLASAVWDSGNKGYHVHCFIEELKQYSKSDRQTIRGIMLKMFKYTEVDMHKKSENVMIQLECAKHRKTGRLKDFKNMRFTPPLRFSGLPVNLAMNTSLPQEIKDLFVEKKIRQIKRKITRCNSPKQDLTGCPMLCIEHFKTEVIPEGYRDSALFSLLKHTHKFASDLMREIESFSDRNDLEISYQDRDAKIKGAFISTRKTGCEFNKTILDGIGMSKLCKDCMWRHSQ